MNTFQRSFKQDILNAIFKLTGKVFLKVTGVYALNTLGIILIFGGIIVGVLGINQESLQGLQNPEEIQRMSQEFAKLFIDPTNIIYLFIALLAFALITSWGYYFVFILVEMQVKNGEANFNTALGYSFRKGVFELFGIGVLLYIVFGVLMGLSLASYQIAEFLPFIFFPIALLFTFRFTLIIPAFIVGGYSLVESMNYSLRHITWVRSLKLVGITILFSIGIFGISMVIGMFSIVFALIPGIGQIIQLIIQIGIGSFFMAFIVAALTALYYRYEEDLPGDDEVNLEDHLIAE